MDYEKILESLKICGEVGTSCEGCSGRGERHCIANLTKAAAIAIETLLHAPDMAIAALMEQEGKDTNAPTNADRIRAMSDEALAEFLIDLANDGNLRIKEWLQQPAEEDDHD